MHKVLPCIPFVVLSHGRSGSNFLMSTLNNHPQIRAYMELLHPDASQRQPIDGERWDSSENTWDFVNRLVYSKVDEGAIARGFKLFYFHARGSAESEAIWRTIADSDAIRLVLLHRTNLFAAYVSEFRARTTGKWHPKGTNDQYFDNIELEIPVTAMIEFVRKIREYQSIGEHLCRDRDSLSITYEDLATDAGEEIRKCVDYLGVSHPLTLRQEFIGTSVARGRTRIKNLTEVRSALADDGFEWMASEFE